MTTSTRTSPRAKRIASARKRRQRQKLFQIGIIILGLGLILVSVLWLIGGKGNSRADLDYGPEDIVYDQPLHAVHEMDGPKLNQIPFLPKDSLQPKIAVSEKYFNFGSVGPTDVVTYDFAILNLGKVPLTISRAYTTCGCTEADFTATVIPPGKVSVMTLTFDAGFHDVRGQTVRRGVIIENNDPTQPELEIWTQAAVGR